MPQYLYEFKQIRLEQIENDLFDKIRNIKVNRQYIGELAYNIFEASSDYLIFKYRLYDEIDSLQFSRFLITDLKNSNYFNSRIDGWSDTELKEYISFRTEWDMIKFYKKKFSVKDFAYHDLYFELRKKLLSDGLDPELLDGVFSHLEELDPTPLHFYYKPKSIEIQMKRDKFDISKFNFFELIEFTKDHREALENAEEIYNVNKEIIVAILRKETNLGRYPLKYDPLEVLLAQALFAVRNPAVDPDDNPNSPERMNRLKRSAEKSLYHIIKFCVENEFDPAKIKSNFVGALGHPQFMPFNLHLAKDGNGDGVADLSDVDDAIISIGNYLNHHGWKKHYELDRINKQVMRKLIGTYNKSETYTESVFEIAYELKKRMNKPVK